MACIGPKSLHKHVKVCYDLKATNAMLDYVELKLEYLRMKKDSSSRVKTGKQVLHQVFAIQKMFKLKTMDNFDREKKIAWMYLRRR